MTIPLEQALLMFSPHTAAQQFQSWVSQPALNVKGFGAKGDGVTDDTAAIQACFNAAFTAAGNGTNTTLNKPVYFPPGTYLVTSPFTTSVTGTASGAGSAVKLAVTSTSNFSTGDRVQVSSVGGTTEANGIWYITVNDSTHMTLTGSAFSNAWTSGGTVNAPALKIKNTQGARVFGAGMEGSIITCGTANAPCLSLDGFGYSTIENMEFVASSGGYACDYSWSGNGVSSQEVRFSSCFFTGGAFGLSIGASGSQSSENLILSCAFGPCTTAGLYIGNFNSLANNVIGGNFQSCGTGILVSSGSVPFIYGVGFQQSSTNYDITVNNSSNDAYHIAACRSESQNFAFIHAGPGVVISSCIQLNATSGKFLFYEAGSVNSCIIDSCYSQNGAIDNSSNGRIYIRGGTFGNASFIPSSLSGQIVEYDIGPIAVGSLPAAQTALKGLKMFVTDATATTFNSVVAGTGGNAVPVFCDGSNWRIG